MAYHVHRMEIFVEIPKIYVTAQTASNPFMTQDPEILLQDPKAEDLPPTVYTYTSMVTISSNRKIIFLLTLNFGDFGSSGSHIPFS